MKVLLKADDWLLCGCGAACLSQCCHAPLPSCTCQRKPDWPILVTDQRRFCAFPFLKSTLHLPRLYRSRQREYLSGSLKQQHTYIGWHMQRIPSSMQRMHPRQPCRSEDLLGHQSPGLGAAAGLATDSSLNSRGVSHASVSAPIDTALVGLHDGAQLSIMGVKGDSPSSAMSVHWPAAPAGPLPGPCMPGSA